MKLFNIIAAVLFVIFAGLQYNDLDPYIWMPIYLYTAVLCALAAKGKFYRLWYLGGIAVYLIYAVYLFFDRDGVLSWATAHEAESITQTMVADQPWIEETREFFGLFLLIIALLLNYIYDQQKRNKAKRIEVKRS
ncbi:transmembrane family 220 protein [Chitinophaga skermanii]|uniref:Transmembrane family 220 protein n=1 Tax=Chitinophaga skermanii TaxID=331697 RepID=A0A327R3G7_9BACT|nr:transmembrane 220 family protein [Chitinophaga skermanii]RAJ10755.1 transmembrane family 220 protein [Chitinophaga skermanii]